ncbi:MAG TPA: hypothetical protein VGI11_11650 [Variovorax sp.]
MKNALRTSLAALCAAGSLMGAASAWADDPGQNVCDGVQQDRNACLREKGAAREAARRGALPSTDPAVLRQNALARCTRQPPSDRAACEARVTGQGDTTMSGSVLGGGIIRQTVTPVTSP